MKRFTALLLVAAMALSMAACQFLPQLANPNSTPAPTMEAGEAVNAADKILEGKEFEKVYKTYFTSSYASFNYYTTAYATVREIIANCIDGLVEPNTYGVYVPSLAESWKSNDDQTVWTFKIREGLKWVDHTGKETEYE